MKKILSVLLTAAMLISAAAIPVSADYTEAEYDIVDQEIADETVHGDTEEKVFQTTLNTNNGFFLSFEFKFDTEAGQIRVPQYKGNGDVNKVGPIITLSDDKLVTAQSNGSQALGEFTVGEWYKMEMEGRTGIGSAATTCRLYDAEGNLVQETPNFDMRNISSENRSFTGMDVKNATVKNIKLIAENPDEIALSADSDTINAGENLLMYYTMKRLGVETAKHSVQYAVYNEDGTAPLENDNISITENGVLVTSAMLEATTTVTVRASASFGEKELVGTKQITVNKVDTEGEKFDTVTISGEGTVKAGTSVTYTVAVTKNGNAVDITEDDIVWKVYDSKNMRENKSFKIENGILTIPDEMLPQDIVVRASSVSGLIVGTLPVKVEWSENQAETVYAYNACETDTTGVEIVESVDGSGAYKTNGDFNIQYTNQEGYTLTSLDIKFPQSGAGLILMRRDYGKSNTQITSDGKNIKEHGGQILAEADPNAWYHIEIAYSVGDASCNIYKYNEDGSIGERITKTDISRWNDAQQGSVRIYGNTIVDNIKITAPIPNDVSISLPRENMFAGETLQAEATASRNGLPIKNATGLTWEVLDDEGLPIIDENALVKISGTGLLTVDAMAPAQKITVRVTSASGHTASADVNIQTSEIFEVKNIGVNEDRTKITKLYIEKKFNYSDNVAFIIAIRGGDGTLKGVSVRQMYGDAMNLGENELTFDLNLPSDFNSETDEVSVMVWTTL